MAAANPSGMRHCPAMTDTTAARDLDTLAARTRAAADAITGLRQTIDDRRPWPLAEHFGVEPEARWGPPEILAHLSEMVAYWSGEIERVLAGPSEPVPFGRVAANELRIGVIERDRSLPTRELLARLESGVDRLTRRLRELDQAEAARRGIHPTLGEMTVAAMADKFVAGHLEEHAEQLRAALDDR
jgi:hypothetical protein